MRSDANCHVAKNLLQQKVYRGPWRRDSLSAMPAKTDLRSASEQEAVNPVAVWEIKEYYYTTTFGSRVADGVYETLLDGMELEELREHGKIDITRSASTAFRGRSATPFSSPTSVPPL